ncbi:unnamed protein product [Effrenium voratum]|nr:unnamed protein product [Effrenium voratum]
MPCRVAMLLAHAAAVRTLSNLTQDSHLAPQPSCEAVHFVHLPVPRGIFVGGKWGEAKMECEQVFGTRGVTFWEGRWLQEKCKDGVDYGHGLCDQETNTGPSIAPEEIVDHWEMGKHTQAGQRWEQKQAEWCRLRRTPVWRGFKDCFHLCQFRFRDCGQLDCKVCSMTPFECDGIRNNQSYDQSDKVDWSVAPVRNHSFFDACVFGCQSYVRFKSAEEGAGPACQEGSPLMQHRTQLERGSA